MQYVIGKSSARAPVASFLRFFFSSADSVFSSSFSPSFFSTIASAMTPATIRSVPIRSSAENSSVILVNLPVIRKNTVMAMAERAPDAFCTGDMIDISRYLMPA